MNALNRVGVLVGVPLVAMAVLAVGQLLTYRQLAEQERDARAALAAFRDLSGALRDAESGQRGYLLSGDRRFLTPYETATQQLAARHAAANAKVTDPEKQRSLATLVEAKQQEMSETLQDFAAGETAAAVGRLQDGAGRRAMEELTTLLDELSSAEQSRIENLQQRTRQRYLWTLFLLIIAAGLGLGLGITARRLIRARIDEVERTAADLALSEARYRGLVESAPDAVFVNVDGKISFHNRALAVILGADDNTTLMGRSPFDFIDPAYHTEVRRRIECVKRGQTTPTMEQLWMRLDGSRFTALVSAAPFKSAHLDGIQVTLRDISDLKRVAKTIEQSEARMRRVLDNLYVFVGVLQPDGTVLEANLAPLQRAGLTLADVRGKPFWDCHWWLHDESARARVRHAVVAAQEGQSSRFDVQAMMANGVTVDIDLMVSPVYDDDGELLWIVPSAVDIADRVAAEARTLRSEAQARRDQQEVESIYAQAPVGLCQLDEHLRFRRVNEKLASITGRPLATHFGERLRDVMPSIGEALEAIAAKVLTSGEPAIDIEIERPAPVPPHAAVAATPESVWRTSWFAQRGDSGQVIAVNAVVEDVTQAMRLDRALRESERRERLRAQQLESLMMSVPAAVWIAHDAQCQQITGNRESYELVRMPLATNVSASAETAQARPFIEVVDGHPVSAQDLPLQRAARTNAPVRDARLSFLFDDGEVRHVAGHAAPLRDETGAAIGAVAAFMDVTELHRARDALSDAARRKDEFLAMLAHELRNPLAPIGNAASLLKVYANGDARLTQLHKIVARQVDHLSRLVDDLLDVSRITRGKVTLDVRRLDLADIVQAALDNHRDRAASAGVQLEQALVRGAWVDADPVRMTQVVANLIDNAIKYSYGRGTICVTLSRRGDCHELSVSDEGQGIEATLLPHVFDLFVQGEQSLDRKRGGLGIGLTLVRQLVTLHGGTVTASSDGVGCGATFAITLPARAAPGDVRRVADPRQPARLRLMVVDDNVDAADSIADLLRAYGHDVDVAYDATRALARAGKRWPDAFILDLGLPVMDGFELAQRLQSLGCVPAAFIALTGYGQEQDRERSRAAGFGRHLVKPVSIDALLCALADLTSIRRDWV